MSRPTTEAFVLTAPRRPCSRQFRAESLSALGLDGKALAVRASGALLRYIAETQKCDLGHINELELIEGGKYMELDWAARRSLELTSSLRTGEKRGSLLWVLDHTRTPMGARMLRSWVEMPLLSLTAIRRRLAAVSELVGDNVLRQELMAALDGISDMQRVVSRTVYQTANARDLVALADSCGQLPKLKQLLSGAKSALLGEAAAMDELADVRRDIVLAIDPEPPLSVRDGGVLRRGYSEEVERLRAVRDNAAQLLADMEANERERTGIKKLKIGYNRVFGYYIDLPAAADTSSSCLRTTSASRRWPTVSAI